MKKLLIRLIPAILLFNLAGCTAWREITVALKTYPVAMTSPTRSVDPTEALAASLTLSPSPAPTLTPSPAPTQTSIPPAAPIRALRIDYNDYANSRAEVVQLEQRMLQSGVNMVALGAGRLDWTYFKWQGHEEQWSDDVRRTGVDFLAEDAARFGRWADHLSAVVDVFAARYIETHPQSAAITAQAKPSRYLVSTMQLVEGEFGDSLLEMLDYIAANYAVDSISLTELAYYVEGYGEDDKLAYLAYSGRSDWPRRPDGRINIDDPSIGDWRSYEIARFLERAAAVVHGHGKQLFVDVDVSWGHLEREANERGQNYALVLQHADRIVVWDYIGLSGYPPEYTGEIAAYLNQYGRDRVILSIGLWGKNGSTVSAHDLRHAMETAMQSDIPNLWITPSLLLSDEHWQVMMELWGR